GKDNSYITIRLGSTATGYYFYDASHWFFGAGNKEFTVNFTNPGVLNSIIAGDPEKTAEFKLMLVSGDITNTGKEVFRARRRLNESFTDSLGDDSFITCHQSVAPVGSYAPEEYFLLRLSCSPDSILYSQVLAINRETHAATFIEVASDPSQTARLTVVWDPEALLNNEEVIENTDNEAAAIAGDTRLSDDDPAVCTPDGILDIFACSIINKAEEWVRDIYETVIVPFLETPPVTVNSQSEPDKESALFVAWKGVRNLANALLIPIFLVIIFAQALSLNIDAYTIKKALPRLVAAVLLIQFSFFIIAFLVDVTNVLGRGLASLLDSALRSEAYSPGGGGSFVLGAGLGLAGLFSAGTVFAALGSTGAILPALFLLVLPGLLAIAGVFITLIFRQFLIVFLAMLAPIAFLAWALPNTEKVFKMWWSFFIKALMMFPLISLLFAAGSVMGFVALDSGSSASGVLSFMAVIAPLFLIPFTFKMAGPLISGVADGFKKLSSQIAYGKDGKSGLTAGMKKDVEDAKRENAANPRWQDSDSRFLRTFGQATSIANRPGVKFGAKSKTLAAMEANKQIEERGKDLEKLSFDQQRALAYGSEERVMRAAGRTALEAEDKATDAEANGDMNLARSYRQRADKVRQDARSAWKSVAPLAANPGNILAATAKMAERGLADSTMLETASQITSGNEDYRRAVVGGAAFNMFIKGKPSFLRFNDGVGNDWGAVEQFVPTMNPEALAQFKDNVTPSSEDGGSPASERLRDIMVKAMREKPTFALSARQALNHKSLDPGARNKLIEMLKAAGQSPTPLETTVDVTRAKGQEVREPT
ncbi:MAG: ABC transporter permease, partial [Candidatus Saccharimonadales bacterium]